MPRCCVCSAGEASPWRENTRLHSIRRARSTTVRRLIERESRESMTQTAPIFAAIPNLRPSATGSDYSVPEDPMPLVSFRRATKHRFDATRLIRMTPSTGIGFRRDTTGLVLAANFQGRRAGAASGGGYCAGSRFVSVDNPLACIADAKASLIGATSDHDPPDPHRSPRHNEIAPSHGSDTVCRPPRTGDAAPPAPTVTSLRRRASRPAARQTSASVQPRSRPRASRACGQSRRPPRRPQPSACRHRAPPARRLGLPTNSRRC